MNSRASPGTTAPLAPLLDRGRGSRHRARIVAPPSPGRAAILEPPALGDGMALAAEAADLPRSVAASRARRRPASAPSLGSPWVAAPGAAAPHRLLLLGVAAGLGRSALASPGLASPGLAAPAAASPGLASAPSVPAAAAAAATASALLATTFSSALSISRGMTMVSTGVLPEIASFSACGQRHLLGEHRLGDLHLVEVEQQRIGDGVGLAQHLDLARAQLDDAAALDSGAVAGVRARSPRRP